MPTWTTQKDLVSAGKKTGEGRNVERKERKNGGREGYIFEEMFSPISTLHSVNMYGTPRMHSLCNGQPQFTRDWEMAQRVKCSQPKHLSLELHPNKSCVHWQAPVISALGAVQTGGLWGLPSQLVQTTSSRSLGPCSKYKVESNRGRHVRSTSVLHIGMHGGMNLRMGKHTQTQPHVSMLAYFLHVS